VAYIAGLVVVALFFLALHYFTEITKQQKIVVTLTLLTAIFGAIFYNAHTTQQRENMMKIVTKFNQNRTVHCDGLDVNSSNYTLSVGTFTFIGRENTPYYAQMISASTCK
jgi:hypothetical protein